MPKARACELPAFLQGVWAYDTSWKLVLLHSHCPKFLVLRRHDVCALQPRLQISLQCDYCFGATGPFAVILTQIEMAGRSWFALTPAAAANRNLALDAVDAVLVCPVTAEDS